MHENIVREVERNQCYHTSVFVNHVHCIRHTTLLLVVECRLWCPPTPGHGLTHDVHTYYMFSRIKEYIKPLQHCVCLWQNTTLGAKEDDFRAMLFVLECVSTDIPI